MMKFTEAQSKHIKEKAEKMPYGEKVGGQTCRHGLERNKCKECSMEYHKDERGDRSEGKMNTKVAKKEVSERVKGLDEKAGLPVFSKSKKGLKFSHMQVKKS